MRSLFYSFLGYFLTPPGLVAMAALDSSLIFFLPLGIDFVLTLDERDFRTYRLEGKRPFRLVLAS